MRPFLLALLLFPLRPCLAEASDPLPAMQCRAAIEAAQAASRLPKGLLGAIGVVESGRADETGAVRPWPWTIDAAGKPAFFGSKPEAIAAVQALQARGVTSIDVGCMQVNLQHHPRAFASLDEAFDPDANARYAARFLRALWAQTHDWPSAAAQYHSTTPDLAQAYQDRVLTAWGAPPVPPLPPLPPAGMAVPPGTGRVAVLLPVASGQEMRVVALGSDAASLPPTTGPRPRSAIKRASAPRRS